MRDDETFHHRDRCAISGIGWTDFSRDSGRSDLTLATQASLAAIADAGLTPRDIDGIVRCDMDLVRANDLVDSLGLTHLDYYGDAGPGGVAPCAQVAQAVAAVISGHGDQRARVPIAQRSQRPALRAELGDGGAGRRQRELRRVLPPLRPAHAGPDLRPHRPAPHDRLRDDGEGPRGHRHRLPQPGQRQPTGPDARAPADDGRLPGRPDDRPAAAAVRLLPGDRRCRRGGRDVDRAGQGRTQPAGAHPGRRRRLAAQPAARHPVPRRPARPDHDPAGETDGRHPVPAGRARSVGHRRRPDLRLLHDHGPAAARGLRLLRQG